MTPLRLNILVDEVVEQIINEAIALLSNPGVRVHNDEALELLAQAGAKVDLEKKIAFLPEELVLHALKSTPAAFDLFDLSGQAVVHYGGDQIHFDPGSTAIAVLDGKTHKQRPPTTQDFVDFVKLVEVLPAIDAQSTAMVCRDVPEEISDLYRLYLALNFMRKPIITGAFRKDTWWVMRELLLSVAGDQAALEQRPIAVFDICPSPPLLWSDLTCQNLMDCARHGIPAELISMPLAGATAPVTLAAAVVQHTAESLSGVVIHQLTRAGSPLVWGGSPAAFDMRQGTTPMGEVATWLIDAAYAQIGKKLNLPTHAYLGMTDAKVIDVQAGFETAGGMVMAGLAGINMISGAGMMDFESCQSLEKLILDAEMIGMVKRLVKGIEVRDEPIALDIIRSQGHRAEYLALPHTRRWFAKEFYMPSPIIDRSSLDAWQHAGSKTALQRANEQIPTLLKKYSGNQLSKDVRTELQRITTSSARQFGMEHLPELPQE
jgi:trimethylamine---corrinoid protein Co-methyltransferase